MTKPLHMTTIDPILDEIEQLRCKFVSDFTEEDENRLTILINSLVSNGYYAHTPHTLNRQKKGVKAIFRSMVDCYGARWNTYKPPYSCPCGESLVSPSGPPFKKEIHVKFGYSHRQ